jgi:hypothetical protein
MNPGPLRDRLSGPSAWTARAIYLALSILFFGRGLLGHFSDRYIGNGVDAGAYFWFIDWFDYALTHHINLFLPRIVWVPAGVNLAGSAFVPLAGFVAFPLTHFWGPVVAYNLWMLACPPLAAWTAFILCRRVSGASWPSLVGGYVFGFSPFLLSHLLGQLVIAMVFLLPLIVLVTLARLEESISGRSFVIALALLIVGQFLCCPEFVATLTLFGGVALVLGYWLFPEYRIRIVRLLPQIAIAYLIMIVTVSGYLYYFFTGAVPGLSIDMSSLLSANTSNLLIPSPVNIFGSSRIAQTLCGGFNIYEAGAYLGPVAILVAYAYARSQWHQSRTRLLIALFLIATIASLGPFVFMAGGRRIPMPWWLISRLPLFDKAMPSRVSVYSFLALAVIVTLWLQDRSRQPKKAIIGAAAIVLFFLPNPSAAFWTRPVAAPPFFAKGLYRKYIAPGDTVLILPYGVEGESDIWQAMSGMYFTMAGGYVSLTPAVPPQYAHYPAVEEFYNLAMIPDSDEVVKTFLSQKNVRAVIVADEGNRVWRTITNGRLRSYILTPFSDEEKAAVHSMFATLGVEPIRIGGVALYLVPSDALAAYRNLDPRRLDALITAAKLNALIAATETLVERGTQLANVNPLEAARQGLLPLTWTTGPNTDQRIKALQNGLLMAGIGNDRWIIGVLGSPDTLERLRPSFAENAQRIEIEPPAPVSKSAADASQSLLILVYDRNGLARAAKSVH